MTEQDYELLSAYLDDMLTLAEREMLESRLNSEPELRRELNALRQTVTLMRQLPVMKAPRNYMLTADMVGDVRRGSAASTVSTIPPKRIITFPSLSLISAMSTAAAVILIALGLIFVSMNGSDNADMSSASEAQVAAAPSQTLAMSPTLEIGFANTGELSTQERLTASARTADNFSSNDEAQDLDQEAESNAFDTAGAAVMAPNASPLQSATSSASVAGIVPAATQPLTIVSGENAATGLESSTSGAGGAAAEPNTNADVLEQDDAVEDVAPMVANQTAPLPEMLRTDQVQQQYFEEAQTESEQPLTMMQEAQTTLTDDGLFLTATELAQEVMKQMTETSMSSTQVAVAREGQNAPEDGVLGGADDRDGTGTLNDQSIEENGGGSEQSAAIILIIAGILAAGVAIITFIQARRGSA